MVYFSPLHHAEGGLLTPDLINGLRQGGEILVVGAGLGDIERYLVHVGGVDPRCITAADVDLKEYPSELGVQKAEFNMLLPWPAQRTHYQYILIPEALGMAVSWTSGDHSIDSKKIPLESLDRICEIAADIMNNGPRSVPAEEAHFFLSTVSYPGSRTHRSWSVIENALRSLAPEGQLRLNGHCLEMRSLAALLLYADGCDIPVERVSFGRHSITFHRGRSDG